VLPEPVVGRARREDRADEVRHRPRRHPAEETLGLDLGGIEEAGAGRHQHAVAAHDHRRDQASAEQRAEDAEGLHPEHARAREHRVDDGGDLGVERRARERREVRRLDLGRDLGEQAARAGVRVAQRLERAGVAARAGGHLGVDACP
jgi:hypothetical protein